MILRFQISSLPLINFKTWSPQALHHHERLKSWSISNSFKWSYVTYLLDLGFNLHLFRCKPFRSSWLFLSHFHLFLSSFWFHNPVLTSVNLFIFYFFGGGTGGMCWGLGTRLVGSFSYWIRKDDLISTPTSTLSPTLQWSSTKTKSVDHWTNSRTSSTSQSRSTWLDWWLKTMDLIRSRWRGPAF